MIAQASGERATGDQRSEIAIYPPSGPWTVRKNPNSDIWIVSKAGHRTQLLRRTKAAALAARDRENIAWSRNCLKEAASELLAALKAVVAIADRKTDEFDRARAAIAKAEGR